MTHSNRIINDNVDHLNTLRLCEMLPGRVIESFDWACDEIHFTDGSTLSVIWCEDGIKFELSNETKNS